MHVYIICVYIKYVHICLCTYRHIKTHTHGLVRRPMKVDSCNFKWWFWNVLKHKNRPSSIGRKGHREPTVCKLLLFFLLLGQYVSSAFRWNVVQTWIRVTLHWFTFGCAVIRVQAPDSLYMVLTVILDYDPKEVGLAWGYWRLSCMAYLSSENQLL